MNMGDSHTAASEPAADSWSTLPDRLLWVRRTTIAATVLLIAGVTARGTSSLIDVWFADRPLPRDLLFEWLPYWPWTQYLTDIAVFGGIGLVLAYALRRRISHIPKMVALFGIMQMSRAFITILTPLAGPLGNGAHYGFIHMTQNGEFPSGHAASALMCYLLVESERAPRLKALLAVGVVIEVLSLLLSHGHYSVDVIGGLLLSYFLFHEIGPRIWPEGK